MRNNGSFGKFPRCQFPLKAHPLEKWLHCPMDDIGWLQKQPKKLPKND
jgi:hypothetical protein